MKQHSGFTLTELMVVVVVIAILLMVALPAYQQHVLRSGRSDAIDVLTNSAAALERQFTDTNSYTGLTLPSTSANGRYTLTSTITDTTYTLTATATGGQADDSECATFTLDQAGVKTATTAGVCW